MNFISNPANCRKSGPSGSGRPRSATSRAARAIALPATWRSEEHTSELQSRLHLVCRLLLEKKKKKRTKLQNKRIKKRNYILALTPITHTTLHHILLYTPH